MMKPSSSPGKAARSGPHSRMRRPEVRWQLIQAAARVFGEKGIDAARLDDVATEAGFTRGAVYSNFSGKDDLISAVITERVVGKVNRIVENLPGQAGAALPALSGELLAEEIRTDQRGQLLVLEFLARAARDADTREKVAGPRREQRERLAAATRRHAREEGSEPPAPPDKLAIIVLALANGFAAEYMADPDEVPLDVLPIAFNMLWGGGRTEQRTVSERTDTADDDVT